MNNNIKIYEKIQNNYKGIFNAKKRIEKKLKHKVDKEKTYEGLFLFSFTLFENYIEDLFIQLLKNKVKGKRGSGVTLVKDYVVPKNISEKVLKNIILGEKYGSYIDWIPYDKTTQRAKKYLINGQPFILEENKLKILNQILAIRNYIAHRSTESKKKMENSLGFKFLSINHLFSKNFKGNFTYFDNYLLELNSICGTIQKELTDCK